MSRFDLIAFDADDTLWHTERLYVAAQEKFKQLLSRYHNPEWIAERLYATEMRNLEHFGYGVKAFALSLIETAVELTEGRITGGEIQVLVDEARAMLTSEVELFEHTRATITKVAQDYPLMLVTKGDLLDQQSKITRSGLLPYFRDIEIVSGKNSQTYAALLKKYAVPAQHFVMVGNSLPSDIFPVLELGGWAVYIPHSTTWIHDSADPPPPGQKGFYQLEHLGQLPGLLAQLEAGSDNITTKDSKE